MSDSEECPKLWLLEKKSGITPCPEVIRAVGCDVLQTTARRVSSEETHPPHLKSLSSTESHCSAGSALSGASISEEADLGTSELFIRKTAAPEEEAEWLSFGAAVESVQDLEFIRHFIRDVEVGGLCDQFTIKADDELLMVNSDPIVNLSHQQVLTIFKRQIAGDEMVLITRRLITDDESEEYVDFEYIRVCGIIEVKTEDSTTVLDLESESVGRGPNAGLIKITHELSVPIRLNDANHYLRCREGALELNEVVDPDDEEFRFSILYYVDPNKLCKGQANEFITVLRHGEDHFLSIEGQGLIMQTHAVDDSGSPTDIDNNLHLTFTLHAFPHNICAFESYRPEHIGHVIVASPDTGVALRYICDDVTKDIIHEDHPDAQFFIIYDGNEEVKCAPQLESELLEEDRVDPLRNVAQSQSRRVKPKPFLRLNSRRTAISSVYSNFGYRKLSH